MNTYRKKGVLNKAHFQFEKAKWRNKECKFSDKSTTKESQKAD